MGRIRSSSHSIRRGERVLRCSYCCFDKVALPLGMLVVPGLYKGKMNKCEENGKQEKKRRQVNVKIFQRSRAKGRSLMRNKEVYEAFFISTHEYHN